MSEYHSVEVEINDVGALVEALKEMGYVPQVHDVAQQLYGYQGDKRKQKANIILPRSQVGSASNDIGFEICGDKIVMHISEFDKPWRTKKGKDLMQLYAKHRLEKAMKRKSKYRIKSKQKEKNGNIKIKVRYRG